MANQPTPYRAVEVRLPDMDAAVAEVREAHPEVDFEYIGPLPAYSFLELTLASAQPESESQWGW